MQKKKWEIKEEVDYIRSHLARTARNTDRANFIQWERGEITANQAYKYFMEANHLDPTRTSLESFYEFVRSLGYDVKLGTNV